jgi:hypothetical protein
MYEFNNIKAETDPIATNPELYTQTSTSKILVFTRKPLPANSKVILPGKMA